MRHGRIVLTLLGLAMAATLGGCFGRHVSAKDTKTADALLEVSQTEWPDFCWRESEKSDAPRTVGTVTFKNPSKTETVRIDASDGTPLHFSDLEAKRDPSSRRIIVEPDTSVTLTLEAKVWFENEAKYHFEWTRDSDDFDVFFLDLTVKNNCPDPDPDPGTGSGITVIPTPGQVTESVFGFFFPGGVFGEGPRILAARKGGWSCYTLDGENLGGGEEVPEWNFTRVLGFDVATADPDVITKRIQAYGPDGTIGQSLLPDGNLGVGGIGTGSFTDAHLDPDTGKHLTIDATRKNVYLDGETPSPVLLSASDFGLVGETAPPIVADRDAKTDSLFVINWDLDESHPSRLYRKPPDSKLVLQEELPPGPSALRIRDDLMLTTHRTGEFEIRIRQPDGSFSLVENRDLGGPALDLDTTPASDGNLLAAVAAKDKFYVFSVDPETGRVKLEQSKAPPGEMSQVNWVRFFGPETLIGSSWDYIFVASNWFSDFDFPDGFQPATE